MEQTKTKDRVYTFMPYWQPGDDLSDHLEEAGNDLPVALHNWGQQLAMNSHMIHNLAIKINDYLEENPNEEIISKAYCQCIEFDGPEAFMNELVDSHILDIEETSDITCSRPTEKKSKL